MSRGCGAEVAELALAGCSGKESEGHEGSVTGWKCIPNSEIAIALENVVDRLFRKVKLGSTTRGAT
jgi:hypothetical protein